MWYKNHTRAHSHRPTHTELPRHLVTNLMIFFFWVSEQPAQSFSSAREQACFTGLPFFQASWMTRCNTGRSAHWEDFPSQLSVRDILEWGCRAEADHSHLALHTSLRLFPLPRAHQGPLLWPLVHAEGEVQCSLFVPSVLLMLDPGFATSILWWIAAVATRREDNNLEESTWRTALSCHFASSWRNECSSSFPKRSFCALMLRLSGVPCFLVAFYFAISNSATSKALNISRQFIKIRKL